MESKREERNEKVIRGLMKLPPNRRCINCNCPGPQYVCTNFWTFICIACSGIHREFTHRVKSVSMAKFSSQEVEALQKGGNQRAREIFLKDLDFINWRLPDCSNVNKIREFIKNVYVDKKYTGGKILEQPRIGLQGIKEHEERITKASSYHSYSQSPPYDYQYENRKYGKHDSVLTRNPSSDRGFYKGNVSSFLYSPGRLSHQFNGDKYGNEGSVGRVSDFSVTSSGDLYNHGTQSPKILDNRNLSSCHSGYISNNILCESPISDPQVKKNSDGIPPLQATSSFGVNRSSDASTNCADSKFDKYSAPCHDSKLSYGSYFNMSSSNINSASSSVDLFQSSTKELDLFQTSQAQHISKESTNLFESGHFFCGLDPMKCSSTSAIEDNVRVAPNRFEISLDGSTEPAVIGTEGWTTFDAPLLSTTLGNDGASSFIPASTSTSNLCWSSFDGSTSFQLVDEPKLDEAGQRGGGAHMVPSLIVQTPIVRSSLNDKGNHRCGASKSTNPFDVAYELDDASNMFDMNSIHNELSDSMPPSQFHGDMNPTWFPVHSVSSHSCPKDGSPFNAGKKSNFELSDSWNGGQMASICGNPFI